MYEFLQWLCSHLTPQDFDRIAFTSDGFGVGADRLRAELLDPSAVSPTAYFSHALQLLRQHKLLRDPRFYCALVRERPLCSDDLLALAERCNLDGARVVAQVLRHPAWATARGSVTLVSGKIFAACCASAIATGTVFAVLTLALSSTVPGPPPGPTPTPTPTPAMAMAPELVETPHHEVAPTPTEPPTDETAAMAPPGAAPEPYKAPHPAAVPSRRPAQGPSLPSSLTPAMVELRLARLLPIVWGARAQLGDYTDEMRFVLSVAPDGHATMQDNDRVREQVKDDIATLVDIVDFGASLRGSAPIFCHFQISSQKVRCKPHRASL